MNRQNKRKKNSMRDELQEVLCELGDEKVDFGFLKTVSTVACLVFVNKLSVKM